VDGRKRRGGREGKIPQIKSLATALDGQKGEGGRGIKGRRNFVPVVIIH